MLKNHAFEENSQSTKLLSFPTIFTFLRPKTIAVSRFFRPEQQNVFWNCVVIDQNEIKMKSNYAV